MGLFDFFNKKEEKTKQQPVDSGDLKAFSMQAVGLAKSSIEETDLFLPFGGVLTTDNVFQMVVYNDPSKMTVDHREHATIIQKLIMEKYKEPKNLMFFMAWDGVAHLPTGDIDCINVKVDNKFTNSHRIFMYTYRKVNGKVELVNEENPTIKDI
jgi:hypothetical protein